MKFGTSVWLSKRVNTDDKEVQTYSTPTKYTLRPNYLSCMPASTKGYIEILKFGEKITNTWIMVANYNVFSNTFAKGDLMWLDGAMPISSDETTYGNGASANAVIKDVAYGNNYIEITLEENQNKV